MKKILFLVFQLFGISAFAQYLPLQGRLVQNNAPLANGNYNFSFALFAPNSNTPLWAELQTVPVNGGLYSTVLGRVTRLPRNPFGNSDSLRLTVTLNGTLLDHITIFPALERDLAFRDSIDWVKVTNKPSLDTQKLVVVGRNLTITNGNTIQLPLNATGQFDSTLQVGQSGSRTETGVNQNTYTGRLSLRSIWQSFTFEEPVQLLQIQVNCSNSNQTSFRLKLYNGISNNTQSIVDQAYPASALSAVTSLQTITLPLPLTLNANANYTFEIIGETADIGFDVSTNNPYWYGGAGSSTGTVNYGITDLQFSLIVNVTRALIIDANRSMVKMDVPKVVTTGRFYDKTGEVMPVGSIMAYAGSTPPPGWLWCDGRDMSRLVYRDLFARLGTLWGHGDGSTTFRLPDSRGFFLRGYSGDSQTDPDKNTRAFFNGTVVGNVVGSYQWDVFQSHTHNFSFVDVTWDQSLEVRSGTGYRRYEAGRTTGAAGGNETRPRNMSVLYIIKY